MSKATFYHAGRPACTGAEQMPLDSIKQNKYQIESAPILLPKGHDFHINFGAALADLKS